MVFATGIGKTWNVVSGDHSGKISPGHEIHNAAKCGSGHSAVVAEGEGANAGEDRGNQE
ncbi:hypothetical protein [Streptomyces sp. NBC_01304]|uniref:hypothetical protein n=1 Tax=Streptomyces sp. NBC_01304 TaxID=2903818 RepID=UPI002E0F0359|nr:hypothetical protein OG430_42180 [Streptomyces sp. NBC_01304]